MDIGTKIAEVIIPTPEQFGEAWVAFFSTVSAIAQYRANKSGSEERFGELAIHASNLLEKARDDKEFTVMVQRMTDDKYEKITLGILYEELLYISCKYKGVFEMAQIKTPEVVQQLEEPMHFNCADDVVPDDTHTFNDIKVVTGSIPKLLDKLPNWLRKAIDVIMEALQLTRGLGA